MPVLTHRIITTFAAQAEGIDAKKIVRRLIEETDASSVSRLRDRGGLAPTVASASGDQALRRCSPTASLASFLDPQVLSRLAGFPLFSRRPMQGNVSGRHPSPHRGSSVEFAEYRKYVPGDDLRRLDWRAYGRSDRFFVKEFEADTNLRCCLVLDTSGSMGFGSTRRHQDRIRPQDRRRARLSGAPAGRRGRAVVRREGDRPQHPAAAESGAPDGGLRRARAGRAQGETQLVPVLHELAETIRQRALVVIISDLFVEPELLRGCFQHLRFRKHDVAVFHLLDPQELALRLPPADAVPGHGGRPVDLRRAERDRRALSEGDRRLPGRAAAGRAGIGRRLSPGVDRRELRAGTDPVPGGPDQRYEGAAMSFLQPILLAALPLVALPIIIHLINQRRYQTIRWAAMMFLLAANRMSRGYARLRQWLIMALRMAAIAGLVFAVSRPLAGGWLGLAAGGRRRHDDHPARPLAEHAAAGAGHGGIEARDRSAPTGPHAGRRSAPADGS